MIEALLKYFVALSWSEYKKWLKLYIHIYCILTPLMLYEDWEWVVRLHPLLTPGGDGSVFRQTFLS